MEDVITAWLKAVPCCRQRLKPEVVRCKYQANKRPDAMCLASHHSFQAGLFFITLSQHPVLLPQPVTAPTVNGMRIAIRSRFRPPVYIHANGVQFAHTLFHALAAKLVEHRPRHRFIGSQQIDKRMAGPLCSRWFFFSALRLRDGLRRK
jgi:hypothetical protein